jgi:trehalose 6-phosphate phosphatase
MTPDPLDALRSDPASAALFLDVDGTLAPIVTDHDAAQVPPQTAAVLAELAERYLLVAGVSGRHALDARRIVGLDQLIYAGNHGLELLQPGEDETSLDPRVGDNAALAEGFTSRLDRDALARAGIRLEDKGPIHAIHWRGAADVPAAEARAEEIAADAEAAGLDVRRGRLVLELRPRVAVDKGAAVRQLIERAGATAALYAGDDRTDLDAFRELRDMEAEGVLRTAVCVGVASAEGPGEIQAEADLVVGSPEELAELLRRL